MADSNNNFFSTIEKDFNICIAEYLKNLLSFCGYDNHFVFEFDDNEINVIEYFAKVQLPKLVPEGELEQYLGKQKSNPSAFFIMPGHKKLLIKISEELKKKRGPKPKPATVVNHILQKKQKIDFKYSKETPSVKEKRPYDSKTSSMRVEKKYDKINFGEESRLQQSPATNKLIEDLEISDDDNSKLNQ